MEAVKKFLVDNLCLVYLLQSFAFLIMGIVIWTSAERTSKLELIRGLPYLSLFGIFMGLNELFETLLVAPKYSLLLQPSSIYHFFHIIILGIATLFLLTFSVIILKEVFKQTTFIYLAIALTSLWLIFSTRCILTTMSIIKCMSCIRALNRYFVYFPASVLAIYALYKLHKKYKQTVMKGVGRLYLYLAIVFLFNAIFNGLIVPKNHFFPANTLNDISFLNTTNLPIQLFRAVVAVLIAIFVIRSLRVFGIETQIKTQELTQQRRISRILQKSLFPRKIPKIRNHSIGVYYQSATAEAAVGGDFYDFLKLSKGLRGFVIGDVSGKGIEAAADTSMVKYSLSAYALEVQAPSEVMFRLNKFVTRQTRPKMFITVLYLLYNPKTGEITYANAGHPYPLIFNRTTGDFRFLSHSDIALGLKLDEEYQKREDMLYKGDILILYTDGLIEARREHILFGEEGLVKAVKENSEVATSRLPNAICRQAITHAKNLLTDDMVVVALERLG